MERDPKAGDAVLERGQKLRVFKSDAGQCGGAGGESLHPLRVRRGVRRSKAGEVPQAGPSLLFTPPTDEDLAAAANDDDRLHHFLVLLGLFGGGNTRGEAQLPGRAECRQRALFAFRLAGSADLAAKLHQRLVELADVLLRQDLLRHCPQDFLPRGARGISPIGGQPTEQADRVGLQNRQAAVEPQREDRPGSIAADAGERANGIIGSRELPAMLGRNPPSGRMKLPSPPVVAQPLPVPQHLFLRRGG